MRWIKDSLKFNEWMNAIDYEVDEPLPAKDGSGTLLGSLQISTAINALNVIHPLLAVYIRLVHYACLNIAANGKHL